MSNLWNEAKIVDLLGRSNLAVERAIVAIYNRQTADEQSYQITKHLNNIGFSAADASSGAYMAKWILSGKHLNGKFLEKGRKIAMKYRRQLVEIANTPSSN
jgi:hypothetical protein